MRRIRSTRWSKGKTVAVLYFYLMLLGGLFIIRYIINMRSTDPNCMGSKKLYNLSALI